MADWDSDPWAEEEPPKPGGERASAVVLALVYLPFSVAFIFIIWIQAVVTSRADGDPFWLLLVPIPLGLVALLMAFRPRPLRPTLITIGLGLGCQVISIVQLAT